MLTLQGAQVPSLVGELRSRKPRGMTKRKKERERDRERERKEGRKEGREEERKEQLFFCLPISMR